jgi:GntR family transcriptional regulator
VPILRDYEPTQLPEGGKSRRVYLSLRDEISNGVYPDGAAMPGEQRLAETHGVSRVTIRRALEALAQDGLIEKRIGAGSLVRAGGRNRSTMAADITTLIPQIVEMGQQTTARLLSFSYGTAPHAVSQALGLKVNQRVQTAVRVRSSDGIPFSHLTTHVPEIIAQNYSEADLATTPLFRLLERGGVKIDGANQMVTAALASPEVATALGVSIGSPLLSLTRVVHDAAGDGVEYLSALYRPDMFQLEMTLNRVGKGTDRHWEPVIARARRATE